MQKVSNILIILNLPYHTNIRELFYGLDKNGIGISKHLKTSRAYERL
jgi:hypothetical protein